MDWLDLLREIGFSPLSYAHVVIAYLPNKDKNAKEFDVEPWETAALKLQGRLFRGATSYPSRGSYRRSDETGAVSDEGVMIEQTRMVVSFVAEPDFTEEATGRWAVSCAGSSERPTRTRSRSWWMARCTTSDRYVRGEGTMARLSKEKIGRLLRAKHREPVKTPLYYAPPFLDELRKGLQERLASRGGRPTVSEWEVVRKTRYSKKTWQWLAQLAEQWSQGGVSVSPSQVAARIVEEVHRAGAK